MKITVKPKENDVDIYSAWQIVKQIIDNPQSVIGLATGVTTTGIHKMTAEIYKNFKFPTSEIKVFAVDEIVNIPQSYEETCGKRISEQFAKPLDIPAQNLILPSTTSDDFDKECSEFESRIINSGGIDLQVLGIGPDGHLGFNLPGAPFGSMARIVTLHGEIKERLEKKIEMEDGKKIKGITLGLKTIMNARKIVLVAKGESKSSIIKQAIYGPVSEDVPASVLQLHPNCECILDDVAASQINQ